MSELEMQVPYRLTDTEGLFSLGYSVYTNRQRVLHKGEKVQPFAAFLRRGLMNAAALGVIILACLVLMLVKGSDFFIMCMTAIGVIYELMLLSGWRAQRRNYQYALERFAENGEDHGVLRFDERGITDVSASGKKSFFSWADYRYCLLVGGGIMFLFTNERDEILMMDRSAETEAAILEVLAAFEREDSIRELEIKGKKG